MITSQFIKKIKDFCISHDLFSHGSTCLAAVSGGFDSMVMLDILLKLRSFFKISIQVAHVDHGLRKESGFDAEFVRKISQEKNLVFHLLKAGVKEIKNKYSFTIEEAARIERYRLLKELAENIRAQRIVTGHTASDQAETILFRILRGTGPLGLTGILPHLDKLIVRPLLCVEKKDIIKYASENRIPHVEDESNKNPEFSRNKIRNNLIPCLEKNYNPEITKRLSSLAVNMEGVRKIIDSAVEQDFHGIVSKDSGKIVLNLQNLKSCRKELIPYILLRIFREMTSVGGHLYEAHIADLLCLINSESGTKKISLPLSIVAEKKYGILEFYRKSEKNIPFFPMPSVIIESEGIYEFAGKRFSVEKRKAPFDFSHDVTHNNAFFDACSIDFPFVLRHPEKGEKMTIMGMKGSRLISRILIDLKIPVSERGQTAVIARDKDVLWLAGLRRSGLYPVTLKTMDVIIFRII
jgi:tRNA(Ile)-lysidine synthase